MERGVTEAGRAGGVDAPPAPPPALPSTDVLPTGAGRPVLRALLVPADTARECALVEVAATAAAISDTIGGGLLDDQPCEVTGGAAYSVYADLDRDMLGLPANPRALRLAQLLGWPRHGREQPPRGDVLVLGLDHQGQDAHVPESVVAAAVAEGLLPQP